MAQLNLYVPDELAAELRHQAEVRGQSLSSLVVKLIEANLRSQSFDWDRHFAVLDQAQGVDWEWTRADRYFGKLRDVSLD